MAQGNSGGSGASPAGRSRVYEAAMRKKLGVTSDPALTGLAFILCHQDVSELETRRLPEPKEDEVAAFGFRPRRPPVLVCEPMRWGQGHRRAEAFPRLTAVRNMRLGKRFNAGPAALAAWGMPGLVLRGGEAVARDTPAERTGRRGTSRRPLRHVLAGAPAARARGGRCQGPSCSEAAATPLKRGWPAVGKRGRLFGDWPWRRV